MCVSTYCLYKKYNICASVHTKYGGQTCKKIRIPWHMCVYIIIILEIINIVRMPQIQFTESDIIPFVRI